MLHVHRQLPLNDSMTSINWLNVLKLIAAFALALGAHFITPDTTVQALADAVAILIAQRNRAITTPQE